MIPLLCSCGRAVPAYFYCGTCRKVEGDPNCPCGKPLKGVRVPSCPACVPAGDVALAEAEIRRVYYRKTGICETGDCRIPTCPTCRKAEHPAVACEVCFKTECSHCARICWQASETLKRVSRSRKPAATVTYSDKGRKYNRGDDKDRPAMFVEAWTYQGEKIVQRTLIGFEKKENA